MAEIAVGKEPVEIQIPKELLGKPVVLAVAKGGDVVSVGESPTIDFVILSIRGGGRASIVTGANLFARSVGTSQLSIAAA